MTAIGVLCLDTSYTKIPGHIRNPTTFGFPVLCKVVRGATADRVVHQADRRLLNPFISGARELEAAGVAAITSGCGLLSLFQRELADAVGIPVYTSSLIQLPMVHRMLSQERSVGVLTASSSALTPRHLAAVSAESVPIRVAGMDDQPEFREVILEARRDALDAGRLRDEALDVTGRLMRGHPDVGAVVIECTDVAPFAPAIRQRAAVPVFDIVTLTEMVYRAVSG